MSSTKIALCPWTPDLDLRGRPTVETEIRLENGAIGRAIAPAGVDRFGRSGRSTRRRQAVWRLRRDTSSLACIRRDRGIDQAWTPPTRLASMRA